MTSRRPALFLRLRGLPFSAGEDEIREFFTGLKVLKVHFINSPDGRPAGECYCEFENETDVNAAVQKNQATMGSRYIEIFSVGEVEFEKIVRRQQSKRLFNVGCLRARGLPFTCKKVDLIEFFKDLNVEEIVFGKEHGDWGRPTGEAYIRFGSKLEAEKALRLNGQHIGHRYLELFRINREAFELFKARMLKNVVPLSILPPDPWGGYNYYGYESYHGGYALNESALSFNRGLPGYRFSPYDFYNRCGLSGDPHGFDAYRRLGYDEFITPTKLQMRGVPFRITPKEVEDFFAPLQCIDIKLGYFDDGRSTGDAIVEFSTMAETQEALKKDKQLIGNRYIELFSYNTIRIQASAFYKTVGGKMAGSASLPTPLSVTGYHWSSY